MTTATKRALKWVATMTALTLIAGTGAEMIAVGKSEDIWWLRMIGSGLLLFCGAAIYGGVIQRMSR